MAKKAIGSSVPIGALNDIFSSNSLDSYGDQRWPRVTSNISINNHFRNRVFYKFTQIRAGVSTDGNVRVTSPFSTSLASSKSLLGYVIDGSVNSSISVAASPASGKEFLRWQGRTTSSGTPTTLSTGSLATFTLSNVWSYNYIEALFVDEVTVTAPSSLSVSRNFSVTGGFNLSWPTPSSGQPDNYEIHFQVDYGAWSFLDSNVPGTDTTYSTANLCYAATDDAIVRFRIRSKVGTETSSYRYSSTITQAGCSGPGIIE